MELRTSELSVGYGKKTVISGVNIQALRGQIIGILGPNGSGKTTLLRTLAGLLAPLSGTVYLNQENLSAMSLQKLATRLAVVLTGKQPIPRYLTVMELVAAGRYPYTDFRGKIGERDLEKIYEALRWVQVEHLADRYVAELSDGEQQKVMLARALAQDTELIILDEPSSFLDLKNRTEFLRTLMELSRKRGMTVIWSLHEVDVALKCCETVILVKDGAIQAAGPPEGILNEEAVCQLYGGERVKMNMAIGNTELDNPNAAVIWVVGGGGTGTPVYRLLTKHGYGFATGILHQNDVDYHVASTMGVKVTAVPPFSQIDGQAVTAAKNSLAEAKIIIDSGFPLGVINRANLELITEGVRLGKPLISLREAANLACPVHPEERCSVSDLILRVRKYIC